MYSRVPRSVRVLAVCLGLVQIASQAPVISYSATADTPCDAMRRWATQYEGTQPSLDDVARFDRARRIAIFNAVSPAHRAALWQEQLERFTHRADLTATQRGLIAEARALATPALYERDVLAQQAVRQFWARAKSAFEVQEQARVWYDLGSAVQVDQLAVADSLAGAARNGTGTDYCECNTAEPWPECGGAFCNSATCERWIGCGPLGGALCNGNCAATTRSGAPVVSSVGRRPVE